VVAFRREDRARVASGEITVTFRLWKTAKVRAGKRYRTGPGTIEIEDVQVMPAGLISKRDVPLTGCHDVEAIRELAGEPPVGPETLLYRVQFRFLGDVAPSAARPPIASIEALGERLAKMDRLSRRGPWTLAVLRAIDAGPRVPARMLAAQLGWETLDFKSHVRRLKALGLTISHDVGYEFSEVGRRYLRSARRVSRRPRSGGERSPRTH
jgi:hypothetical protein